MLLQDKVVIVSGVGPGLGQANARALAREGATVVLAARNAEYLAQVQAEIEADGGRALAVPTNLVDAEQVAALVARTIDEFGRLDVLVNNAFRMDTFEPFEAVDLAKWRKIFEVNVWGALGLTQACLPHLKDAAAAARRRVDRVHHLDEHAQDPRARRRLLVVEGRGPDRGEDDGGRARADAACASTASRRVGSAARTSRRSSAGVRGARHRRRDDVRGEIEARIPLGLIPPQDDIANSVVFFVSPWSRVVTGQTLDVNGGEFLALTRDDARASRSSPARRPGIGRAIAVALGGLGWTVALGARRVEQLEETARARAPTPAARPFVHALDVTDPASIDAFLARDARRSRARSTCSSTTPGTAAPGPDPRDERRRPPPHRRDEPARPDPR